MIGKTLGQYEVISALGQGGMGEVYRARDTQLDREVAIKVLPREMSGDPERIARFRREARTLATLQHPNVATIYGFEDTPEARFLVMELVEGEDLSERLERGPMPVDEAIDTGRQIAAGLEAAHENSVMHRDLKPANVKITPDGTAKILDFGLARAWLGDSEENVDPAHSPTITAAMTQAGTILGTAAYMSPEQARGKRVDRRADIWAFGVIVVEMLRGQMLFPGETVSDTLASVLKTEIDLSTLPQNTPPGLRRLIDRCLDRNPANRLRDIGEARIALEGPLDDEPVRTTVHTTHRGRLILLGALAGVVLGAAAAAVFGTSEPEPSSRQTRFTIPRLSEESVPRSSLTRDGSRLAYVDQNQLWVRDFAEPRSRAVPGSEGALVCGWSPDGEWIVWSTTTILYKARPDGTGLSRLCTVGTDMHPWAGNVAWTEDDLILFAAGDSGIRSLSSSGGDPATFIPTLETDSDFHGIHVLPDDRGFLFMPHIDLGFDSIDLLSNNGRKQLLRVEGQQLHSAGYTNGHILFSRRPDNVGVWAVPYDLAAEEVTGAPFMAVADARFPTVSLAGDLVYSPDSPVRWQIVRVDRRGDITAQVAEEVEGAQLLRLSPDGTEAVYAVQGPANEIWIVDLTSGSRQRFAFDEQLLGSPSWSPDGSSLVYTVGVDEGLHQQLRARDGGAPETLHVRGHNPLFTPDGRHLVLEIWDEQNNPGIGYIDLDDREAGAVAIVDTNFEESAPALSPDGTLIAYESLEPGRREVFVTTFPDGDRSWQISNEGGSQPCWSADGSEIIFRNPSFPQKMVVEVSRDPVRFSAPRLLFSIDGVAWLNATEDRGFWGLRRVETGEQNSFEVWLGWAESLDR